MKLIPAPGRQFRTWSMILLIIAGLVDLGVVLAGTLAGLEVMSTHTLAIINAGFAFATGAVRLVHQQVAMTTDEKVDVITDMVNQPVHDGEHDVTAKIITLAPIPVLAQEIPK